VWRRDGHHSVPGHHITRRLRVKILHMNGYLGESDGEGDGTNGYVSINFVAAPETSTWTMSLMGFAGLGWLAHLRSRKVTPA
jgi:hypothetical protein